jgi:hypothetical protein
MFIDVFCGQISICTCLQYPEEETLFDQTLDALQVPVIVLEQQINAHYSTDLMCALAAWKRLMDCWNTPQYALDKQDVTSWCHPLKKMVYNPKDGVSFGVCKLG